ncbi:hypothetical protein NQ318_005278 [Aromia moschata]|uniref:Uncharacterized protein n=1 Tax=Aromia moschata TaxID=1265417 RepID=A0AAV8Y280_9CUCU|nr:hypothetical protein NQ318_005278 [Aromia moschata]
MDDSKIDVILNLIRDNCYKDPSNENRRAEYGKFCEAVFDGYFCWPVTVAGELAIQACSNELLKSTKKVHENPHAIRAKSFQREFSINVWMGLIASTASYLDFLQNTLPDLFDDLPLNLRNQMYFMHDGASKHFARIQGGQEECEKNTGMLFQGLASRQCSEDGTWAIPINHTVPWSNLTQCGSFFIETGATELPPVLNPLYSLWIPILKNISYFGYAISIVSLITALSIFVNIKRLHCPRNKLHINLFISFIMRFFMSIMKDGLFIKGTALVYDIEYIDGEPKFSKEYNYSWVCKAIISIRWYFILSNFMLMLMEGVYLYNLMFVNLFSDSHGVTIYCILGWGLPLVFVISWIIARILFEDVLCWTQKDNNYISFIIEAPIRISVVINFILFLTVLRVLVVKLNNACIQQRRIKYSSLLLVVANGLFAALLYCLLNNEVQVEIKRKYSSLKDRTGKEFRRSRTISNTQQFYLQAMDESPENGHQNGNGITPEEILSN